MITVEMIIEKTSDGFSAFGSKYDIYTFGATQPELKANINDAVNLHFQDEKINPSEISVILKPDLPNVNSD